MASVSLKRQFTRHSGFAFTLIGLLLIGILWATDFAARQDQAEQLLKQRALAVQVNFSAYLDRAEFEAKYLAQQVGKEGDLDSLFQLHDVLFFGGLDFFYVQLSDGQSMLDPRSRLYTRDALNVLSNKARLNYWMRLTSSEGSELLVFKKVLPVDDVGRSKGYLYGFISLDNNLALSSDLMSGADVDYMRLQDLTGKTLLEDTLPRLDDETVTIGHTSVLSLPALVDKFKVELKLIQPLSGSVSQWFLLACGAVVFGIALLYWSVQYYARRWMYRPLSSMPTMAQKSNVSFEEFEPLIAQMNRFQTQLKAGEQHLHLLLDSLQSAILFCDESARVTAINQEAKTIFPDYGVAKTIFDMAPLDFHQPIQSALKGDFGGRFELEAEHVNKIYEWLTYSFVNEYGFRGVMLVGRDITELRRLAWHIDNLHPNNALDRPRPEPEVLINEMSLLDRDYDEVDVVRPEYWLRAVHGLLSTLSNQAEIATSEQTLGDLFIEQLETVGRIFHLSSGQLAEIELGMPLTAATRKAHWSSDHKCLFQVALLLCLNGSMAGRRLMIDWQASKLTISVQGASEPTPILAWLLEVLPKLVKGRVFYEGSGRITLLSTIEPIGADEDNSGLAYKVVAFIENDFYSAAKVKALLTGLNIELDVFGSFDEFFHSSRAQLVPYDGLLVGVGDQCKAEKGISRLITMCDEASDLPLLYVGDVKQEDPYPRLPHSHLFSYGMLRALQKVFTRPTINLVEGFKREQQWLLVGGSPLVQAVWQTELRAQGVTARKEPDMERLEANLSFSPQTVVLLLDKHTAQGLMTLDLPETSVVVTIEDFLERPDFIKYFEVGAALPSADQVADLCRRFKT